MNNSEQTWNENETFPLFELLARKIGFLPLNNSSICLDAIEFNTTAKILVRLTDDGNPNRSYLDLQLLILEKPPKLLKIWGESLQIASTKKEKISLAEAVVISLGEDIDRIFKEEWQKSKDKTTKIPIIKAIKKLHDEQTDSQIL